MSENTTDTPITDAFYDGPCKNAITRRQRDFARDLERQLAEARMAFAIVTDKLVVEQSAHRRTRERIDRIADALRGIRKHWTWVVDPECDCEDCEFSRPIDEALATLERKEEG